MKKHSLSSCPKPCRSGDGLSMFQSFKPSETRGLFLGILGLGSRIAPIPIRRWLTGRTRRAGEILRGHRSRLGRSLALPGGRKPLARMAPHEGPAPSWSW